MEQHCDLKLIKLNFSFFSTKLRNLWLLILAVSLVICFVSIPAVECLRNVSQGEDLTGRQSPTTNSRYSKLAEIESSIPAEEEIAMAEKHQSSMVSSSSTSSPSTNKPSDAEGEDSGNTASTKESGEGTEGKAVHELLVKITEQLTIDPQSTISEDQSQGINTVDSGAAPPKEETGDAEGEENNDEEETHETDDEEDDEEDSDEEDGDEEDGDEEKGDEEERDEESKDPENDTKPTHEETSTTKSEEDKLTDITNKTNERTLRL